MGPQDPRWKAASEGNSVLLKMDRECKTALTSVEAALKLLKKSPLAKGRPGSVGPEAVKSLAKAAKALEDLVGNDSAFVWEVLDPDGD